MKTALKISGLILAASVSCLALSACEDDPYYHHHHDRLAMVDGDYDVYYDNFYGPFSDGYWGDDNAFYYMGADHRYHRDDAGHIRRDAATGFNTFHVHHHYGR